MCISTRVSGTTTYSGWGYVYFEQIEKKSNDPCLASAKLHRRTTNTPDRLNFSPADIDG